MGHIVLLGDSIFETLHMCQKVHRLSLSSANYFRIIGGLLSWLWMVIAPWTSWTSSPSCMEMRPTLS